MKILQLRPRTDKIAGQDPRSEMLLEIHNELLFDVTQEEVEEMKSLVGYCMPRAAELGVPLITDINPGQN